VSYVVKRFLPFMESLPPRHLHRNHLIEKAMRTLMIALSLLLGVTATAQVALGDIIGTLYNSTAKEGVFDATVVTNGAGDVLYRTKTDPDGSFRLSAIPSGKYQVYFLIDGDTIYAPRIVEVAPDGIGDLGKVEFTLNTLDEAIVTPNTKIIDLIKKDPAVMVTGDDWRMSPAKFDTKAMIAGSSSDVRQTEDGSLVFRGARKGDMVFYLDGVKMNEVARVPSAAVGYMMVYAGAIPAKYGDTNGGVVVMETLSYTDLYRAWRSRVALGEQ
jgi:hypothetical protein